MDKEPLEAKKVQHLTLDQLFELSLQELRKREGITESELRMRLSPTTMYLKRYGSLAIPLGKARSEGYVSLLSHTSTIPQRCVVCNMACRRSGVQETATGTLPKLFILC